MNRELQGLLWFCGGFALAGILSVSYEAVHYVPVGVAFGLLCFGCGLLLSMYLHLRWRIREWYKTETESVTRWSEKLNEVQEKESGLEEERKMFESEKETWEAEKQEWEEKKVVWEALHPDDDQESK